MTEEDIINAINKVEGINGMTVNERLFASGLMDEYDKAKWQNKPKAKRILELLGVDEPSVNKIVKPSATRKHILYVTCLVAYLLIVTFTKFSLVGFWTDIIFSIAFSLIVFKSVFSSKTNNKFLTNTFRTIALICTIVIFGFFINKLRNPFIIDVFKLRTFYYQSVDNRLFNGYFKPVGAYGGGYGNFWISECPKYFPIIEREVHFENAVHYDFKAKVWDGKPTNHYEVLKDYIVEEVINKK